MARRLRPDEANPEAVARVRELLAQLETPFSDLFDAAYHAFGSYVREYCDIERTAGGDWWSADVARSLRGLERLLETCPELTVA